MTQVASAADPPGPDSADPAVSSPEELDRWLEDALDSPPQAPLEVLSRMESWFDEVSAGRSVRHPIVVDDAWRLSLERRQRLRLIRAGFKAADAQGLLDDTLSVLDDDLGENLVVRREGTGSGELGTIVLCASNGTAGQPTGMIDVWTSCALLAWIDRRLEAAPIRRDVVFVLAGASAFEHYGAQAHANALSDDFVGTVHAAVCFHGLGMETTRAWFDGSAPGVLLLADEMNGGIEIRDYPGLSEPFGSAHAYRRRGIPTISFDGVSVEDAEKLGTVMDGPELLDRDEYRRAVRFAEAFLRELDDLDDKPDWDALRDRYDRPRGAVRDLLGVQPVSLPGDRTRRTHPPRGRSADGARSPGRVIPDRRKKD